MNPRMKPRREDSPLFDFAEAKEKRDRAISQAAHGAESVDPGFHERALAAVKAFAKCRDEFLTEDVRQYFGPCAVDPRAWGPLMKHAEKLGIVEAAGFARAASSHLSQKTRWRSKILEPTA